MSFRSAILSAALIVLCLPAIGLAAPRGQAPKPVKNSRRPAAPAAKVKKAMPTDPSAPAAKPKMSGNPVFPGWYADPELHLFRGKYFIYPTTSENYELQTYFEVWSSDDLTNWVNGGRILNFADIPWSTNRAAWAPSVAEKDGKYYMYFSAGDGAGIGVAVADAPGGPFRDALGKPLVPDWPFGAQPIDAQCFIDDNGQAYLYFGGHSHAAVVKLGKDMISLDGPYHEITPEDYVEGPYMVKRKGIYYFMWSEGGWGNASYAAAYARSSSPLGPFKREGRILQNNPKVGAGAGHHSVLNIPGTDDWYACYHRRPLTETHHNHRVVCIDRMYFNAQGGIEPIEITAEGVPARPAKAAKK
ncbi:MAG TPA: glycoside hydrolase family 43 protein [Armatimonadota bacterium]|jgi:beta-xylosidase